MAQEKNPRLLFGYIISGKPLYVSILGIFTALTTILTLIIRIPIGPGYLNFGDAMVMITGLLFGPWVGAFAGGIGSMIADFIGYPLTSGLTLIAKGLEGFLVGMIANPRLRQKRIEWQDIVGIVIGGLEMVSMYFIGEYYFFQDPGWAVGEFPGNFFLQFGGGIVISLLLVSSLRKTLMDTYPIIRTTFFSDSSSPAIPKATVTTTQS